MADELTGKTILLVDDEVEILNSISAALEDLGPTVLIANDGRKGIAMADEHHPDLVVLDQMMPGHSGLLVLQHLRTGKRPKDPPQVIMITANLGLRHQTFAKALGVEHYLNKPFRMSKLLVAIRDALGVE